jgi:hypothetical protein
MTIGFFTIFLLIGLGQIAQSNFGQWSTRPNIVCDNGEAVHRYAEVNARRVNIRDLPTVFSNVLHQKSYPERVTIVCEFGVWSRIALLETAPETWISSGLITLLPDQPFSIRTKLLFCGFSAFGLFGLLVAFYRPHWLKAALDILLKTQDLPPHARPLISKTPQFHPARDQRE